jgi:hypothetical protein
VRLNQVPGDGQPDPASAASTRPGFIHAVKTLKEMRQMFQGDADPRVAERDDDLMPGNFGAHGFSFLQTDLRAKRQGRFRQVLETGQPARWEDEASTGIWDNNVYPILTREGTVDAFAVYSRDITEQKRLESELQTYTEQLEHRMRSGGWKKAVLMV